MSDVVKWDERWREKIANGPTHHGGHDPDPLLVELIEGLEGAQAGRRVLELGCGLGANAIWLAKRGWEVSANDLSPVALEEAAKRAREAQVEVNFVAGDSATTSFEPDYDLVALFYLHLPTQARAQLLANARSALAPGAKLLFVGHDATDERFAARLKAHGTDPEEMLTTAEDICRDLAGLTIERAEAIASDPHCSGEKGPVTLVLASRDS